MKKLAPRQIEEIAEEVITKYKERVQPSARCVEYLREAVIEVVKKIMRGK